MDYEYEHLFYNRRWWGLKKLDCGLLSFRSVVDGDNLIIYHALPYGVLFKKTPVLFDKQYEYVGVI